MSFRAPDDPELLFRRNIDRLAHLRHLYRSMLRVNLMDLDRDGPVRMKQDIAPDLPVWEGIEPEFAGPVELDLTISATATGQVLVRGTISAAFKRQCRRCLADVTDEVNQELNLVWVLRDEFPGAEEEDAEAEGVRILELTNNELDLGPALREELILAIEPFVECSDACQGLCPVCGVNRNQETCDCTLEEPDPRWDVLRALNED